MKYRTVTIGEFMAEKREAVLIKKIPLTNVIFKESFSVLTQ